MEFLSRQTFVFRENVSVWTERQIDKIGKDILETLKTLPCARSLIDHIVVIIPCPNTKV